MLHIAQDDQTLLETNPMKTTAFTGLAAGGARRRHGFQHDRLCPLFREIESRGGSDQTASHHQHLRRRHAAVGCRCRHGGEGSVAVGAGGGRWVAWKGASRCLLLLRPRRQVHCSVTKRSRVLQR